MSTPDVGFVGLGIMGRPMARTLLRAGRGIAVHDVDPGPVRQLQDEGAEALGLTAMGRSCPVVLLVLPNGTLVADVLFGDGGLAEGLSPGAVVVDMSSVTPAESRDCHDRLRDQGVDFLDAPVSGGEPKAADGTLAFMVGGREEALETVRPLLMQMGSSVTFIGPAGSGSVAKLANQIVVNLTISALGEALVFATKAGVDPGKVVDAIRGGLAGSAVMDAKAPMILDRDFRPGGKIAVNHKDLRNVLRTAHELDIPVPMSAQLFEVMQGLKVRGLMEEDHAALVKHVELLAGVEAHRRTDQGQGGQLGEG